MQRQASGTRHARGGKRSMSITEPPRRGTSTRRARRSAEAACEQRAESLRSRSLPGDPNSRRLVLGVAARCEAALATWSNVPHERFTIPQAQPAAAAARFPRTTSRMIALLHDVRGGVDPHAPHAQSVMWCTRRGRRAAATKRPARRGRNRRRTRDGRPAIDGQNGQLARSARWIRRLSARSREAARREHEVLMRGSRGRMRRVKRASPGQGAGRARPCDRAASKRERVPSLSPPPPFFFVPPTPPPPLPLFFSPLLPPPTHRSGSTSHLALRLWPNVPWLHGPAGWTGFGNSNARGYWGLTLGRACVEGMPGEWTQIGGRSRGDARGRQTWPTKLIDSSGARPLLNEEACRSSATSAAASSPVVAPEDRGGRVRYSRASRRQRPDPPTPRMTS